MPRKSRKKKAVQEDPQDPINASLGQLRRQNERLRKEIINIRSGKEIIREVVEDIYNRNPDRFYFDVPDVPQALKKRKKQPSEIAVLHLSDIHVGKRTISFDSTVCAERMRFLTEKVLRITDMRRVNASIDEIRVYLGGDMIEGETIFGGQAHEIDSNLFEQTILNAPEILTALVLNLLKSFKKVKIATVPGNHGRNGSKYSGAAKKTNWDRVFYAILKTNLLGTDQYPREDLASRLSWLENHESFWVVDRVYDWGNLIFHGDQIKGGFAGFPWYGAAKKLWGYIDLIPPQWDYAYIGHFHTPAMVVLNHRILLANGTFESDNEFALEQLASGGFPCQRLAYYNEDHGLISDNPIWLVENRVPHLMRPSVR